MARNSKLNKRSFSIFLITALSFNLLTPDLASSETPKPKEIKASCRIEIDNAHISTSLLKNRKLKYVKVNARSICNVYQQRVTLTVEIFRKEKLSNQLLKTFFPKTPKPQIDEKIIDCIKYNICFHVLIELSISSIKMSVISSIVLSA
jgi:hypothetical protein